MQFRPFLIGSCGLAALLLSSGCEGLGACDEAEARTLVVAGSGQVLYAGQAVMNRSCAAGQCHSSGATGEARQGVPKGLDFNVEPAAVLAADAEGAVQSAGVWVDRAQLSRLRQNQRSVFDWRDEIWEQVEDALMPPDGVGASYRQASLGAVLVRSPNGQACQAGEPFEPFAKASTREIMRNWLACGAPVVEVSSESVPVNTLAKVAAGNPGTVGQQMPLCGGGDACDDPITFDDLYTKVIQQSCVTGCHAPGGFPGEYLLHTKETAYETLTTSDGGSDNCGRNQPVPASVVPGKPEESYILTKMGAADLANFNLCGLPMPLGQNKLECGVRQMAAWILAGAPAPGEPVDEAGAGNGGADAGP
jgi:hypothetical protein